jgi:hypothetical protein
MTLFGGSFSYLRDSDLRGLVAVGIEESDVPL